MMKRWICVLAVLLMLLSGCEADRGAQITVPEVTDAPAVTTGQEESTGSAEESTGSPEETTGQEETQTPVTEPPTTNPPATQPPVTNPPATQPPATNPPATNPPETEVPGTQPPATEAPATQPPATTAPPAVSDPYDISGDTITALEQQIMDLINQERQKEGAAPLQVDAQLCAITSVRAYECSLSFSHTRPGGESCFSVLDDYGYTDYWSCGENILKCSAGYYSAADMVQMWMDSQGHRENILNTDYTKMGLGLYEANGYYYVANLFAGD